MQFFLRLKHWQLFIINFGIPVVLEMIFVSDVIMSVARSNNSNPAVIANFFWIFPIIMLIAMGSLFGWIWAVGTGLQKLIPEHLRLKIITFKIFLIIPVIYILFLMTGVFYMFGNFAGGTQPPAQFFMIFALIIPVHLFSMFCIFYCLYFAARTIKTAELQRPVTVSDYIGEFFLIWFFFIGVWILQPRINKLITGQNMQPA